MPHAAKPARVAIYLPSLSGGGAERVMLNLAVEFSRRDIQVSIVLAHADGPYLASVPSGIRIVDFGRPRVRRSLVPLVRYLRRERPAAMLAAMTHANIIALLARRIAGVPARLVVSEHNVLSRITRASRLWRGKLLPCFARKCYPWADGIVAVSSGVADDLARVTGLRRDQISVIYNPVVSDALAERASQPVDHPWFAAGQPPVILAVGRLAPQKDFPTLLRAFAQGRSQHGANLMLLGEGDERPRLEQLVDRLGIRAHVQMPGFVDNPLSCMARAAVFVMSSVHEGLPTVLVEALACGTPVVSTDCPSGPAEILRNGEYGMLVPVGDVGALERGITETLGGVVDRTRLTRRAQDFRVGASADAYLRLLLGPRGVDLDMQGSP